MVSPAPRAVARKFVIWPISGAGNVKRSHAKKQFSAKVGTIFEDSPISLDKWLSAVWMITAAKNGISSWEIHRSLGVTQKTAWFMLHRIRLGMQDKLRAASCPAKLR